VETDDHVAWTEDAAGEVVKAGLGRRVWGGSSAGTASSLSSLKARAHSANILDASISMLIGITLAGGSFDRPSRSIVVRRP
jgi:hypothetical protein